MLVIVIRESIVWQLLALVTHGAAVLVTAAMVGHALVLGIVLVILISAAVLVAWVGQTPVGMTLAVVKYVTTSYTSQLILLALACLSVCMHYHTCSI